MASSLITLKSCGLCGLIMIKSSFGMRLVPSVHKTTRQLLVNHATNAGAVGQQEPIDFGERFAALTTKNLSLRLKRENMHPRDIYVEFDSSAHVYSYDCVGMATSVTRLVSSFFSTFDADVAIQKMITGRNWPRPQYMTEEGKPLRPKEIKAKWDFDGLEARNRGTWMHHNIELFYNSITPCADIPEFSLFLKFHADHVESSGIEPYRTEWQICAPDLSIGGSIDFVGRLSDGTFVIMDWKRSKRITDGPVSSYGRRGK